MTAPAVAHRRPLPNFRSPSSDDRRWLRGDLIAGVSNVIGLDAAPPVPILYAPFGSSRHLVVGPMSVAAARSAAAVADPTIADSLATLTAPGTDPA